MLVYIFLGGLTSAIYNEVLQFFLIVAGFLPLVLARARAASAGWTACAATLPRAGYHARLGRASASPATNPMGVEWFGLAMGLGFVLSFGYWCTDFLVVQRAMAADSMTRGAAHAADRGRPEDALPVPGDPAGADRARAIAAD